MAAAMTMGTRIPAAWRLPLALLLLALVTAVVWWPLLANGFIDFDDDLYVTANAMVQQGLSLKGISWAFTTFHAANWHPLTWLSHMLDVTLFGMNPAGHHAMSLFIHTANALLLCTLLYRLTGFLGRSLCVALLFALHPLHVESVAWVAERKDLLATLFFLLTIHAYCRYADKPSLSRYLPVAALFALGLMAKQMVVTLPLLLLLLDLWPLGRFRTEGSAAGPGGVGIGRLVVEKLPLLGLAAFAAVMILRSHAAAGALFRADQGSLLLHSGNALLSYVKYIVLMVWPTDLALFYPFEAAAVTPVKVAAAAMFLVLVTAAAVFQRRRRPYLLCGWVWYLVTLVPVIGFIRVGGQALADRYTYIPLIGLFLMIVWGGGELAGRWQQGRVVASVAAALVVVVLSGLTVVQLRYWQSSYDLYAHALAVVERNWLAHNNMGILLSQHNRNGEALVHFRESVRLNPQGAEGFRNLGNSLQMAGRSAEALAAFREAVRIHPQDPENRYRLGYAYLLAGDGTAAYQEYLRLTSIDGRYADQLLASIRLMTRR